MPEAMSFRCPRELRDKFSAKAQEQGSNASSVLKEFMRQYLENPSILESNTEDKPANTTSQYTQDCIDSSIDTPENLSEIQTRIEIIEAQLEKSLDTEKLLTLLEGWATSVDIPTNKMPTAENKLCSSDGINQNALAKRLGVDKSSIRGVKHKSHFSEYTKKKDPEGKAWRYDQESQLFFPLPLDS